MAVQLRQLLLPYLALFLLSGLNGHQASSSGTHSQAQATEQIMKDELHDDAELVTDLHRSLRFEPANLDFGSWSVGTAHSHTVTLVNQNTNSSVYLSSVSGRTPEFYSSFFEAKVVPPQGNTTFNVVFLPREHGMVATDLLIHTSFGLARLLVRGEGRKCPYRLKPIVGVKAPLNATLMPEIHMYNPHERPLQILEVYSSGGQFQLELPSGGQEGPQALWEIPPHTMKPVIRIRFQAGSAGNYTAYIRIKISEHPNDSYSTIENVLVVPVEFEILQHHGIYAENPLIDFGRLTTMQEKPLEFQLKMRNSNERRQHTFSAADARDIPGLKIDTKDGIVSFDPRLYAATASAILDELIMLRSISKRNNSEFYEFSLILRAEVFKGALNYDRNVTMFVTQSENYMRGEHRILVVRNDFELPLALLNVSIEKNDSSIMQIQISPSYRTPGFVMLPGKTIDLLHLKVLDDTQRFSTHLRIYTNVTLFELPVSICSGRLHVTTLNSGWVLPGLAYSTELNLGAIPLAETSHNGYIVLRNHNPMPIKLTTWDFHSPQGVYFHTTFLGCMRASVLQTYGNESFKIEVSKFKFCSHLEAGDMSVFQVAIQSYNTEHSSGELKIWTTYEQIVTNVKFITWMGKLEVDQERLYFKNCFPGKMCSSDLSIRSTFKHPIKVKSINFTDAGLRFDDFNSKGSTIAPDAITKVGRIYFEPAMLCQNRCYIPQDEKTSAIAFPLPQDTKGGLNNNFHFDETELWRRTELFRHLKWYFQTISFTLTSNEVRQFLLQLIIDIEWPKLVRAKQRLATFEVGKPQQLPVVITNPADSPVLVDYYLADPLYAKETEVTLPHEVVDISSTCYLTDKPVFALSARPARPVHLPARSSIELHVQFESPEASTYCTLLHIRNNLTLYEAVWLQAKTVQSQFRFGNRKPGSPTPLLFEFNEKHMAVCTQKPQGANYMEQPMVIIKRTFTARNTGEIPIWIETFLVGDKPCEGYGFKIIDCSSFALKANASKKIEIAFSPDFTLSRVARPLVLKTNLSYDVNYMLVAQLPAQHLEECADVLPRPPWEDSIRRIVLIVVAVTFVFVLVAVHIDYGNILLSQSALYMSRDKGPVHPTFNLRNIAMKEPPSPKESKNEVTVTQPQRQHNRNNNYQPQKISNNNVENQLKRRSVKKPNVSPRDAWQMPDLVSNANSTKEPIVLAKSTPTFSERNFKLRLEADKAAAAAAAQENAQKLVASPPKATNDKEPTAVTQITNQNASSTKKPQRTRKSKPVLQPTNEKTEKDAPSPPRVSKTADSPVSSEKSEKSATADMPVLLDVSVEKLEKVVQVTPARESQPRKHGKTPGRERKKDSSTHNSDVSSSTTSSTSSSCSSRKSERKHKHKAVANLSFESVASVDVAPADNSNNGGSNDRAMLNCITSPWDTSSQVSFSDVLQLPHNTVNAPSYGRLEETTAAPLNFCETTKRCPPPAEHEHALLDNDLNRNQTAALQLSYNNAKSNPQPIMQTATNDKNFSELGPIGTKKSPSTTPVWEPIQPASTPSMSSNLQMPKPIITNNSSFFSNLLPTMETPQYMTSLTDVSSNFFELKKAHEELQRQLQSNILTLQQQQLQAQVQTQLLQSIEQPNNWTSLSAAAPTWSPMNYGQSVNNAPVNDSLGLWQNTGGGMVRPPPGLETGFSSVGGGTQQLQPNVGNVLGQQPADLTTFDPFTSLSSIWSDNWNRQPNQQQQQHNNNHIQNNNIINNNNMNNMNNNQQPNNHHNK